MAGPAFAGAGAVLADILGQAHLAPPEALDDVLTAAARPLGISAVRIYLADIQQRQLYPLADVTGKSPAALAIESTLAGRAFQTITAQRPPDQPDDGGPCPIWLPLLSGTQRLGVVEMVCAEADETTLERCQALASLAGLVVASKEPFSDAIAMARRSRPVALQAELVHALTVPSSFATSEASVTAILEPAYEVGGDAFDFSALGDRLQVAVFDGAGHDLAAGLVASVTIAACRSTRRAGGTLADMGAHADRVIAGQFRDLRFATALLCELNTSTGEFTWIPYGHPPPLLIRDGKVIKELAREPWTPLGLGRLWGVPQPARGAGGAPAPYSEQLEGGDRLLLYTDGVTEGRGADGSLFGLDRLTDFIIRTTATGLPAPETLRRLDQVIMEFQGGRLSDDATILLLEWLPGAERPAHGE